METLDASKLFEVCDLDGSGYIDETELGSICRDLPEEEVHDIFLRLDKDGDGQISVDEFTRGFKEVYMTVKKRRLSSKGSEENETAFEDFTGTLEEGLKSLSWKMYHFTIPKVLYHRNLRRCSRDSLSFATRDTSSVNYQDIRYTDWSKVSLTSRNISINLPNNEILSFTD